MRATTNRIATAVAFTSAARRYWLGVFPVVRREIGRLTRRAMEIPDPVLRHLALDAQRRKWASLEGAAAFAAFAPLAQRAPLARLLVDLQGVFDYADTLMEQPSEDPAANARQLHGAFLNALDPDAPHSDYYRHHARRNDGEYLVELVDACRAGIRELPSYRIVADAVLAHAWRIVFYQSDINLACEQDHPRFTRWATEQVSGADLHWWELGAACGSSLAVFAHIAAAADPALTRREADSIEAFYWPWAEALHIFLDSLIDRAEDAATGQQNLLDHYVSKREATERLLLLARETLARIHLVAPHHRLILAGMIALYLSDEQAWVPEVRPTTESILQATGTLVRPAMFLLRVRRVVLRA